MTAVAHEPITPAEGLLEIFLALDTPEGFRAELIEGEIVVTPPPDGDHEDYISLIVSQVIRRSRTDIQFSGHKGLKLKSGEAARRTTRFRTARSPPRNCGSTGAPTPGCHATASPWCWR